MTDQPELQQNPPIQGYYFLDEDGEMQIVPEEQIAFDEEGIPMLHLGDISIVLIEYLEPTVD